MSNFDLRKFLAEGKLHEEMTSTEEAMDKPSKMKMSDLKKKIREEILSELTLAEDVDIDTDGGEETEGKNDDNVNFYEGLEEATKDGDGEVPSKDTDTDIDIVDKEEVEVDVEKKPKATGIDNDFLDQLEDLKDEADAMGDNKLERQIDNTMTYFTRQHIAKDTNESIELEEADKDYYDAAERDDAAHIAALEKDMEDDKRSAMKESLEILKMKKLAGLITEGEYTKESLNEDLTSTITILLAFLIGIPGVPIAGALIMGLIDYIFNGLPDQYNEYRSLKSYKESDKQEEILALAKEIESKLSPGKKRYLKTLVNRIGVAKLEDKAREYRALDRYASSEKDQMDRGLDENLNADIKAALEDLPVPTDMNESLEILRMKKLAGLLTEGEYAKALLREMQENESSSDLKVKWTPEYIKNEKQDFFYTEKGLADGFEIMNGKKVKEIVGYFEDENGDEDFEIIGFIYSTSGKDVSSYSEDDMYKAFYDALGI